MSQTNNKVTKHRNINTLNNNHPAPHTATNSNSVNSPKEVKKMGGRGQEQLRGYARERKPPNAHKKGTPANHLLNYSLNIPKATPYTPVVNYKGGWVQKERYLQANFHFTVKGEALYSDPVTPDYLAKWHYIKDVTLPTLDECQCPICLEPPTAPKITKCGHLFCWPCLLHYFNATFISSDLPDYAKARAQNKGENNTTSQGNEKLKRSAELVRTIGDLEVDQMYKKCPFCSELFSLSEIKPVHILQMHRYQEGDELEMTLLKRNKLSTVPIPSTLWAPKLDFRFPCSSSSSSLFSRFQVEENESINSAGYTALEMAILQREKDQLTTALLLSSPDDTDHLFLDLALLQIQTIQDRISSSISSSISSNPPLNEKAEGIEPPSKPPARVMDPHAPPFVPSALNNSNDAIKLNVNNNSMNNKNMNVSKAEEGDYVYFYQEKSGLKFFLHPICSKALIIEYGSQSHFPPHITAKILQIDEVTVDDYFRKRYKFLSHLPLSTICYFCEVEMKHLVSPKTLKSMGNVFKERKIARRRIQLEKQREAIPSPLFPKTSIDWNDSPALPVYFEAQYHVGEQEEEGEEEGEGMKSPQWVPNSSALSLDKLKSSPLRISPSLSYSARSSQRSVGDGDEEDGDEVPDYSQSFFNSISSLSLPSSSSSSSSKKKKKQNKVLFFDTSQKRKY